MGADTVCMARPSKPRTPTRADATAAPTSVQSAIKQTRPFHNRRQEAVLDVLLAAEAVRWPFQDLLAAEHDLTLQQYNVLRILRGAGPDGLPTLEIAERMVERTPGVTRLIDRLEHKKLVVRNRSATDRRQVFCALTPAGDRLLAGLDQPVDELDDSVTRGLSEREVDQLIVLLDKLRAGIDGAR